MSSQLSSNVVTYPNGVQVTIDANRIFDGVPHVLEKFSECDNFTKGCITGIAIAGILGVVLVKVL